MVYRNKEGYADPTAGAAIHEAEPKAKKKEYNPEVTNLVSVLKQMIDIAGYEMVGRIVLRDKDTGRSTGKYEQNRYIKRSKGYYVTLPYAGNAYLYKRGYRRVDGSGKQTY